MKEEKEMTEELIDAKGLYSGLFGNRTRKTSFNVWISRQIKYFGLIEYFDYWQELMPSTGGRPEKKYLIRKSIAFIIKQRHEMSAMICLNNRKETMFFVMLEEITNKIESIQWFTKKVALQFPVKNYYTDCYYPVANLVVEYDEIYHKTKVQAEKDKLRESEIKEELECSVIRVKEGSENKGIGEVINFFINLDSGM